MNIGWLIQRWLEYSFVRDQKENLMGLESSIAYKKTESHTFLHLKDRNYGNSSYKK